MRCEGSGHCLWGPLCLWAPALCDFEGDSSCEACGPHAVLEAKAQPGGSPPQPGVALPVQAPGRSRGAAVPAGLIRRGRTQWEGWLPVLVQPCIGASWGERGELHGGGEPSRDEHSASTEHEQHPACLAPGQRSALVPHRGRTLTASCPEGTPCPGLSPLTTFWHVQFLSIPEQPPSVWCGAKRLVDQVCTRFAPCSGLPTKDDLHP